jgi:hypothetical protein
MAYWTFGRVALASNLGTYAQNHHTLDHPVTHALRWANMYEAMSALKRLKGAITRSHSMSAHQLKKPNKTALFRDFAKKSLKLKQSFLL